MKYNMCWWLIKSTDREEYHHTIMENYLQAAYTVDVALCPPPFHCIRWYRISS